MSPRAVRLHETADRQIAELAELLSTADVAGLTRPCPGRGKLGDGTVGAVAAHTAENYRRIAQFLTAGTHHERGPHGAGLRASATRPDVLLDRLAAARQSLTAIGRLGDEQLDSVPPAGGMKFADGERTLEQIIASLLKHQRHQVDALAAALS